MAKHMTLEERKVLEARYNAGQSVPGIANAMGFNFSTIYKELKRGDTGKMDQNGRAGYSAVLGQQRLYKTKQRLRYQAKSNRPLQWPPRSVPLLRSGSDMRAQGAACFRFPIINRRAGSMPAVRTRKEDNFGNKMLDPGLPAGKTGI